MTIRGNESQQPDLHHEPRRENRRSLRMQRFVHERPSALTGVDLRLELGGSAKVQRNSEESRDDEQRHHRPERPDAPSARREQVPAQDDDRHGKKDERQVLPRIFVMLQQDQFDAGTQRPKQQDGEHTSPQCRGDIAHEPIISAVCARTGEKTMTRQPAGRTGRLLPG